MPPHTRWRRPCRPWPVRFRQRLLRAVFGGEVTGHDGEHIDDLLQTPALPYVVVMNPPFASSVDRSRDKHIAAKHLIAAAKRLAPGGRLVAIMPPRFSPERDAAHWSRACGLLTPRLALTLPGQVYRKLGTSVETQLMIFDKVQVDGEMTRATVQDLEEALPFVDAVAANRPEPRPAQRAAINPHARSVGSVPVTRKRPVARVAASNAQTNAATRLSQILDWMGNDFDGVLTFDEAHAMQNAAGSEQGRGVKPSQQGLAGLRLQLAAPRARVFYISATGATSVHNLAYAARLGLWGQGPEYPFPSRESFVSAMEAGGVAAMEVVARDLKTLGLYTARALSFDGVKYDVLEHAITPAQIEIYDAYAGAFRTIHHNLEAALTATGVNDASGETNASAARASAKSRFESTKQRFFNHLLKGMKAPTVIRAIEDDLAAGNACVIQVVSTGESLLKRRLEMMDREDELVEGALTPRDYVLGYLEQAFPIHAQKLVEIDGNMVAEPLRDETGALVVSREALALRDAAMMELMTLAPIPSALDQILWAFGDEAVAEVTGRSIRPLKAQQAQGCIFDQMTEQSAIIAAII
ncbi:strawberry notch family protein [Salipiger sp. P9]|nr:strawberry notch family protein [Salipiger pentaromativorans]MCR8551070.1 strawberry notch family protein [Salipiger pentaromativorans]